MSRVAEVAEPMMCGSCNGSGQGQYDGWTCYSCSGKGVRYLNGDLIRVELGREGSPVSHIVWDSYAQREVRIYPKSEAA